MQEQSSPFTIRGDSILLKVKAFPKSGRSRLDGARSGELIVRLQAPADRGEANREMVKLLSKSLAVPKAEITILAGGTSRHKLIRLPESARAALEEAL